MNIKILFDKLSSDKNLRTGWGVSFLIDGRMLFDTGERGDFLINNMQAMGVDIKEIESVIISHNHHDHTGGLMDILKKNSAINVYACPGFGNEFDESVHISGARLIQIHDFTEIFRNTFVTGEMQSEYKGRYMPEQALAVKTKNGVSIITGCAHPGIIKIVNKVKENLPDEKLYLVMGGFHLRDFESSAVKNIVKEFKDLGVIKAAPTHCSGSTAERIFKKIYSDNFIEIKVGMDIEV